MHFVEAKLLFDLHKSRTLAQGASTSKPYNTSLEGGITSEFGSHKTFLGNQCVLCYKLAKSNRW